jgi:hypothetical protein
MGKAPKDVPPHIAVLEQTPIIIEKILVAAGPHEMHWKPAANRWSIGEVLGHLVDVEKLMRSRLQRMLQENNPAIEPYDQDEVAASGKYAEKTGEEYLREFCHERDLSVAGLRYLPAGAGARPGRHAETGPITVDLLLNEWAFHDLGHIRQISELYRARAFWPRLGAAQRYYKVSP